ncbi:unnamed protein product [Ambrosiozyma monospora]|uniref:Unnamed protein product n=1 Tax=Ambrosiozyma monospora TaxID=43982 RepID=A0ACB5TYH9_AMBMO|nr:unnamed protein product [Ambrosiozyma monospora]
MSKIWKFLPHLRHIDDPHDYTKPYIDDKEKLTSIEDDPDFIQLDNGQWVKIKEYRDEADRPWWRFFDEFEYRETTEESKNYKWYQWFEDGTTPEEKKLICKLDLFIAFYAFVGYWIKYIDTQNLNNAYVSNMKEDLNMQGNDLINTQTLFQASSVIFSVPSMFLMPRVPLTYLMFFMELGWSVFTLGIFKVSTVSQLQALRWFVGAFEGMYFPCVHYLLASWYKPSEVARRGALFYMGQFLGVLTAGLIASSTYDSLNGVNGLSGWRWMYTFQSILIVAYR